MSTTKRAFALAQRLAAKELRSFSIGEGSGWEDYSNNIGAVQKILEGTDASYTTVSEALQTIGDAARKNELEKALGELLNDYADSGYLYGLAVGRALANGGAR